MQDSRREFQKILAAFFVSQVGSHFLTLAIATFVFVSSGSPVQSALVFVTSYFPSILVSARLGHWIDQRVSKRLIIRNELLSVPASILCGACIYLQLPLWILCFVLCVRSIFMFIGRTASSKWMKVISTSEQQTSRIKLFFLCFFLSTAVSGFLASFLLGMNSIITIVVVDVVTYLLGIGILASLAPLNSELLENEGLQDSPKVHLTETLQTILKMRRVRTLFLLVCFSQAAFQGAYLVFVSYLPLKHLKLSVSSVGTFQIAASIGIILGFVLNWFCPKVFAERDPDLPKRSIAMGMVAILVMIASTRIYQVEGSIILFFGLNFLYECIWLYNSAEFFRASPKSSVAQFQFTLSAIAAFLMSTVTLIYSLLIQRVGFQNATVCVCVCVIIAFAVALLGVKRLFSIDLAENPIG